MGKLAFEEVQVRLEQDLFLHALIESGKREFNGLPCSGADNLLQPSPLLWACQARTGLHPQPQLGKLCTLWQMPSVSFGRDSS